jgi:hypothetical protein
MHGGHRNPERKLNKEKWWERTNERRLKPQPHNETKRTGEKNGTKNVHLHNPHQIVQRHLPSPISPLRPLHPSAEPSQSISLALLAAFRASLLGCGENEKNAVLVLVYEG